MADKCPSFVRGKTLRVTEIDECGVVVTGAGGQPNHVVSGGFVSVQIQPEVDDGEEINQKDANNDSCVLIPPEPFIKWLNVTVVLCRVDFQAWTLLTKWPIVLNEDGDAVGFRYRREIDSLIGAGFELWSGTAPPQVCDPDAPLKEYGYFLLPKLVGAYVSDFTVENGAVNFTLVGKAVDNANWGVGPYDVIRDGTPPAFGPLADTMVIDDLMHVQLTTMPPPAAICGLYPTQIEFTVAAASPPVSHGVELVNTFLPTGSDPNTVDWGDGTTSAGLTALVTENPHVYPAAGTYTVCVTVTATSAVSCHLVTVT